MRARLKARELEHEVAGDLGDRIAVSRDGDELFLYAGTEAAVRAAERVVRADMEEHGLEGTVELARWHDDAEDWEAPDAALPGTAEERAAEHARLMQREDREEVAEGYASWEVRVELPSRDDARALAERLKREGVPSVRRWKYLFVGAADEDSAREWAERLRGEVPQESNVTVEGTFASVERRNPFAVFGAGTGEP
jgi:hypothetical protein